MAGYQEKLCAEGPASLDICADTQTGTRLSGGGGHWEGGPGSCHVPAQCWTQGNPGSEASPTLESGTLGGSRWGAPSPAGWGQCWGVAGRGWPAVEAPLAQAARTARFLPRPPPDSVSSHRPQTFPPFL